MTQQKSDLQTQAKNDDKQPKPDNDKKINLTIIVSGTPTIVEAYAKQKLQVIAQKSLDQTGNTSRPLSDWSLKTREGVVLEMSNTVESYALIDGAQLLMSLDAGIGG